MTQFERVDSMENRIRQQLGDEEFIKALTCALDYDTKEDTYNFICQMYEVPKGD